MKRFRREKLEDELASMRRRGGFLPFERHFLGKHFVK